MKFGVVMFPGSNCDVDCFHVIKEVLKEEVEYIWHKEPLRESKRYDCIILPGGFSYGDYLRPGAIARFSNVMEGIIDFAEKGGLVLGICNGFQVLLEAGLLPGAMKRNKNLRFICDNVFVRVENNTIPFTLKCKKGQVLEIPIAHGDGNYHIDKKTLKEMKENNQIVFRYCDEKGEVSEATNPNGSIDNIAGICNRRGNVLGMMPHPERCSEEILGSADGKLIFDSIMKYLKGE
jgi:phosphoribosylformylglycinamidine synthase